MIDFTKKLGTSCLHTFPPPEVVTEAVEALEDGPFWPDEESSLLLVSFALLQVPPLQDGLVSAYGLKEEHRVQMSEQSYSSRIHYPH